MKKNILLLLLSLWSLTASAQIVEFSGDTTTPASAAGRFRPGVRDGDLYLKPRTGNAFWIPSWPSLSTRVLRIDAPQNLPSGPRAQGRANLGLGSAATLNVPASPGAAAGAAEVVRGDDPRLTTPSAHTHTVSAITGLTDSLAAKVNRTTYNANKAATDAAIATKADNSTVVSSLAGKADQVADLTALAAYNGPATVLSLRAGGQTYTYSPSSTETADGYDVVTATGKGSGRWLMAVVQWYNVRDFGAVGNGTTDDTQAFQRALDAAAKAANPAASGMFSPANRRVSVLYVPFGYYRISDELWIRGAVTIRGEGTGSYSGSRIVQVTPGKHLFRLGKDTDGVSNCVLFEYLLLKAVSPTLTPGTALIYAGEGANDGNNNSLYIHHVWFSTPEHFAVNFTRGHDLKIRDCTFDVAAFSSIRLGSATNTVSDIDISNNIFFDIRAGAIWVVAVQKALIANNRVTWDSANRIPFFIDDVTEGRLAEGITVSGNSYDGVNRILKTKLGGYRFLGDVGVNMLGSSYELGGGGVLSTIDILNARLSGDYSGLIAGQYPNSPIFALGTGVIRSNFKGLSFTNTGAASTGPAVYLPDSRSSGNVVEVDLAAGFARPMQVPTPPSGKSAGVDLTVSTAGVLDVSADAGELYGVTDANPNVTISSIIAAYPGQEITLRFYSARTIAHNTDIFFQDQKNYNAPALSTLRLKRQGSTWIEVDKSVFTGTAGGDLTGQYPNPTLATITTPGTVGSGVAVPVISYDAKGRITSATTTPVSLPRRTLVSLGLVPDSPGAASANTAALQAAINNSTPIAWEARTFYFNGTITGTGVTVDIKGSGWNSRAYMTADADLFDFSGGVEARIEGISLLATLSMNTGTALKIKGAGGIPSYTIRDVRISKVAGTHEFRTGIALINANESVVENVIIDGKWGNSNMTGLIVTNTAPAVSPTYRNIKIYDTKKAFVFISSGNRGQEGLKLIGCDAVGNEEGMHFESTFDVTVYPPPLIQLEGCHVNSTYAPIFVKNFTQVIFTGNSFYYEGTGTATANGTAICYFENVGHLSYSNNQHFVNGTGDPYGIRLTGPSYYPVIANNQFSLKPGGAGIAVQLEANGLGGVAFSHVTNIKQTGGAQTYRDLSGVTQFNTFSDLGNNNENFPNTVTPVNGVLDLSQNNGDYIILGGAASLISSITGRPVGSVIYVQSDVGHSWSHNASLLMANWQNGNRVMAPGEVLIFRCVEPNSWREMGRHFEAGTSPSQFDRAVQGSHAVSRATYITDANADRPSGFYTVEGQPATTGMPTDPSGINAWLLIHQRNENGSGTGSFFAMQTAVNFSGTKWYRRVRIASTGWTAWVEW